MLRLIVIGTCGIFVSKVKSLVSEINPRAETSSVNNCIDMLENSGRISDLISLYLLILYSLDLSRFDSWQTVSSRIKSVDLFTVTAMSGLKLLNSISGLLN